MSVIFVMNAAIGVKICRYTGRTVDRSSSPSVAAAAAAAAAGQHLGTASNSADDLYSNCSTMHHYQMRVLRPATAAKDATAAAVGQQKRHRLNVSSAGGACMASVLRTPSPGPSPTPPDHSPMPLSSTSTAAAAARSWRVLTRRHQTQLRITKALLVVSTVFVALNLPSYAFRIHAFVIDVRDEPYDMSLHAFIWQEFIQFLYYSNFSSRFFLYSACSTNFRQALMRLVCRRHNICARCSWRHRQHIGYQIVPYQLVSCTKSIPRQFVPYRPTNFYLLVRGTNSYIRVRP